MAKVELAGETGRTPSGTVYEIAGAGDPIVFLHGVGLDRHMWQAQRDEFIKTHRVITYDLLNHGESATIPRNASLFHWSAQLDRLLDELKLLKPVIVGFSFGVPVALTFAVNHTDRIGKLVLLNGVYNRTEDEVSGVRERHVKATEEGTESIIDAALERWFSPDYRKENADVIDRIRNRLESNDPEAFLAAYGTFAWHDSQLAGRVRAIKCPTLIMTGERDPGSTPKQSERLAADIAGSELHILKGMRHMAPIEGADEVNKQICAFLAR